MFASGWLPAFAGQDLASLLGSNKMFQRISISIFYILILTF